MTTPTTPQHPVPPQGAPQQPGQAPQQPQGPQQPGQAPAQPYWPGQAGPGGPGGYVSPVPVRAAHLGDAVIAEWTKIRSLRSTMWTLGTMLVLVVGLGLTWSLVFSGRDELISAESLTSLGAVGVLLGMIPVLTLGVLTISSEYGTGLVRTTLTACPSRSRVLTAKAIVLGGLAFVTTLIATLLVAMISSALLGDQVTEDPTAGQWFKATVGVSLYVALAGLLALAVGTLLRHSAGAITTMLGLVLFPPLLSIFLQADAVRDIGQALLKYSIPTQLLTLYGGDIESGPSGWDGLWIMLALAAAATAGAHLVLNKRDA
ncbi:MULTISPECIES: ABC transporter permease subunit [Streptomyces]|uniref:ABC transporter permease subunit n=1 Tax=Streptomyces TaxID=1883 RepID=UPI00163B68D1|nr:MULTISPECIES: ABC transporter permease subunit [Streptomyces]MBC2874458.1 ABC transporter permease subunit [Streptomyces sp. TYQ1024]UBI36767.1 ABC transporter permease subunit [Streptomyces mobaraensis]UKW29359.1 ABC transporter permease subunit [Streptomyces sp. TYQ1024]